MTKEEIENSEDVCHKLLEAMTKQSQLSCRMRRNSNLKNFSALEHGSEVP